MAELAYAPSRSRFSRVQSSLDDSIAAAHDCYRAGDAEEAAAICRRILHQNPGLGEALKFLGAVAVEQGSTGQAIRFYQQALQTNSHDPVVHHGLATALRFAGRDAAAEDAFRQAITLAADWADPFTGLGNLLKSLRRFDEAIDAHRQALRRAPNSPEILSNLGTTPKDSGRHEEAIETLSRALALAPNAAEIHYNLCNAQLAAHRPAESTAIFTRALQLDPGHLRARVNLGVSLKEQGQLAAAITCLRRATSVDPGCADARWNLSLALLLAGDLTEGWQHYEWRRKLPGFPVRHFDALDWDGYPLGGRTLLLHAEQGLGDSLQFIRYAAQIGGSGSRVIFQCPRSLVALLSGCPGLDAVVSDDEVPPDFDVQAPLLSVPGLCGTTLETVPAEVPYLRPPPDRVS